ncbi:MAG TPA: ABC transporter permease [Fimbriimonadaceae bacterium]|nr:ABC transporter permease [Fimbriimonadaceae bacterium]
MSWAQYLRLAMRGLIANKMRTALTMLGIIIGVAVVIIVVAIGQGAGQRVQDAVNSLGTNLLQVRPGQPKVRLTAVTRQAGATSGTAASSNRMTLEDAKLIASKFSDTIEAVAPQSRGNVQIQLGSSDATTSAMGVTVDYPYVNNISVEQGQFFSATDDAASHKVCVVGVTVAQKLTNDSTTDLTGRTISINHQGFLVMGMLTPKGAGAFGQDQDDVILLPINTAMRRVLNKTNIDFLSVRCTTPEMMPLAQQQIAQFLRNRHHIPPPYPDNDDFQITSQTEIMARQATVTDTMTQLLTAVAIISLVVGGIGIMNIMLVSVTERTREIGIRKAIGATPHDILMQFLIEASIISMIGGIIGVIVGIAGAIILAKFGGWNTIVSPAAVGIALVVSAAVGIFFGLYPANKASALHPITALRYE